MPNDRVMRNIQNGTKHIKHMNSFIIARFGENWENFLKIHFQDPGSRISGARSHLWGRSWVSGIGSYQQSSISGPLFLDMPFWMYVKDYFFFYYKFFWELHSFTQFRECAVIKFEILKLCYKFFYES